MSSASVRPGSVRHRRAGGLVDGLLALAALGSAVAALSWLISGRFWPADMVNFARPYLFAAACLILLLAALRRARVALLLAGLACVGEVGIAARTQALRAPVDAGAQSALILATYNCACRGLPAEARAWLQAQAPDIVAFQELGLDDQGRADLAAIGLYEIPSQDWNPRIFVRAPPGEAARATRLRNGAVFADIAHAGRTIRLVAVHLNTPRTQARWADRDSGLAALGAALEGAARPVIVMGDFNAAPHAPAVHRFAEAAALRATTPGFAPTPTRIFKDGAYGAAVDHIFVSPEVAVASCQTGPSFGSDHRVRICEVGIDA